MFSREIALKSRAIEYEECWRIDDGKFVKAYRVRLNVNEVVGTPERGQRKA